MGNSSWGAGHHAGLDKGLQQGRLEGGLGVAAGMLMVGGALWGYKKFNAHRALSRDARPGATRAEARHNPVPDDSHPRDDPGSN